VYRIGRDDWEAGRSRAKQTFVQGRNTAVYNFPVCLMARDAAMNGSFT